MLTARRLTAALITAAAITAPLAATRPAAHPLPSWFRWGGTSDRHGGHPCIITWGGGGQLRAEVCSGGYAAVVTRPGGAR